MGFQRARTPEQTNERQKEIIGICDDIFVREGFGGVTFKRISEMASFSRPTIYNYYETKEEILLDLLKKEFLAWVDSVTELDKIMKPDTRAKLCKLFVDSFIEREKFLELISMHYAAIENGSSQKKLNQFKKDIFFTHEIFSKIVADVYPNITEDNLIKFHVLFKSLVCGLYVHTHLTHKQIISLETALGAKYVAPDFYALLNDSLFAMMSMLE